MMREVSMFRQDGTRVALSELLATVPENNWTWSIIEFDGAFNTPLNEPFLEFQNRIHEEPLGLIKTWKEIIEFSKNINYTIDCLVIATRDTEKLKIEDLLNDEFQNCEIALRAFDSTSWTLFSSNPKTLEKLNLAAEQSN